MVAVLQSIVCRNEHFDSKWFQQAGIESGLIAIGANGAPIINRHRKAWEWVAITAALRERGKLSVGSKAMGFAVGTEPLSSIFSRHGVEVHASDMPVENAKGWSDTNQHAASLEALYFSQYVDRKTFEEKVSFSSVDMNRIGHLPKNECDFVWSSCSLEHLGNLELGIEFIKNSVKLLKPGGVAVHTTEFNLSSDTETIVEGDTVIYREQDLRRLDRELRAMDAGLERLDLWGGSHEFDIKADYAPYHANGREHLKLRIGPYISTSVLLIIQN